MHSETPDLADSEADIADDRLLSVVQGELEAVNKRSDKKLLFALALNLVVVVLFERVNIKRVWLNLLEVSVMVAIIGGTIYSAVWQKQRIAARHGLICTACGYRPGVFMILSAATTQRCCKCRSPLPVL